MAFIRNPDEEVQFDCPIGWEGLQLCNAGVVAADAIRMIMVAVWRHGVDECDSEVVNSS